MTDLTHSRSIRSFVRRNSRMTSGQKKALENYWPDYGIDTSDKDPDLDQVFQRKAPRVLDIGSGMGGATLELAEKFPHLDYIAVEVHQPGVGNLIRLAHERRLTNIRIIPEDIKEMLQHKWTHNAFDQVLIYFPDPWPKKRHHKRRLITSAFLNQLVPCLKSHGRLYIATDWQDYAEQILDVVGNHPYLLNLAGQGRYATRPTWRPKTKFEARGETLGHEVRDLAFAVRPPA